MEGPEMTTISEFSDHKKGKYSTYKKYQDTNISWLDGIPAGWDSSRLRNIFEVENGSTPKSTEDSYWEGDIAWATPDDLEEETKDLISETKRQLTEEGLSACGASLVPKGSILVSTRAPIGHLGVANIPVSTNQGCKSLVFKDSKHNSKYFYYFLKSSKQELKSLGIGSTYDELNTRHLKSIELAIPPEKEQKAIVQFLDRETTQIDKLIRLEKDLIETLKEKRLSIIKNSILGENNSETHVENNREEWLDKVPNEWEISKISNIFEVENGSTPKSTEDSYWEGDIAWATPDDLEEETNDYIQSTQRMITKDGLKSCGASLVPENSILISTRAPIGYIGIAGSEITTNQGCKSLVFQNKKHDELYFYYQLMASKQELKSRGMGSTYNELSSRHLKSINLVVPPVSEQNEISEYISEQIKDLDESIEKIKSAMDLSYEYRNALITNAVTGQIDVRGEV